MFGQRFLRNSDIWFNFIGESVFLNLFIVLWVPNSIRHIRINNFRWSTQNQYHPILNRLLNECEQLNYRILRDSLTFKLVKDLFVHHR